MSLAALHRKSINSAEIYPCHKPNEKGISLGEKEKKKRKKGKERKRKEPSVETKARSYSQWMSSTDPF